MTDGKKTKLCVLLESFFFLSYKKTKESRMFADVVLKLISAAEKRSFEKNKTILYVYCNCSEMESSLWGSCVMQLPFEFAALHPLQFEYHSKNVNKEL